MNPGRAIVRGGALFALLSALLTSIVGCGGEAEVVGRAGAFSASQTEPIQTRDPARTFAPLVSLHAREYWLPMDPQRFIAGSSLDWAADDCIGATVAIGSRRAGPGHRGTPLLMPWRLGDGAGSQRPYRHRPLRPSDCLARNVTYATTQLTRPFARAGRPKGLGAADGFVLDVAPGERPGSARLVRTNGQVVVSEVPAFNETRSVELDGRDGRRITYWLFYGMTMPRGSEALDNLAHEGGWERVSVLLLDGPDAGAFVPVSVRYHAYGDHYDIPWRRVALVSSRGGRGANATHPTTFAALGSHANYPRPGAHSYPVTTGNRRFRVHDAANACRVCPQWRTWERLRPARAQPWYGFGGSWGDRDDTPATTGPLGPSRFVEKNERESTARRVRP